MSFAIISILLTFNKNHSGIEFYFIPGIKGAKAISTNIASIKTRYHQSIT